MTDWVNCERMAASFIKIKPQPNPAEFASAFFMPVNILFFQNLRQEESRKSALHALIERITAYPDRKMAVKLGLGKGLRKPMGDKICIPTSRKTPDTGYLWREYQ